MSTLDDHARAGVAAIEADDAAAAIEHLSQAVALAPERPDLNFLLGSAFLRRGEAGTAIEHLERAVELAESYSQPEHQEQRREFWMALASAYQLMDHVLDSRRVLEGAIARWPQAERPKLQLAQLLLGSCQLEDGLAIYQSLSSDIDSDMAVRAAGDALVQATRSFQDSGHSAKIFLQGHQESYCEYFDQVTAEQVGKGWYVEAARMTRGPDGEPQPILAQGARPYAMERVDLVNPHDGSAASIYSEKEPMIVAMSGLEPLAEVPILFPWAEQDLKVWVSTRCPWHWLDVLVQFEPTVDDVVEALDPTIGDWYLAGFNGDFGERDAGRFHFVSDPLAMHGNAVAYTVDLGRARFEAIDNLLARLAVLHTRSPIRRVIFGQGKLPE